MVFRPTLYSRLYSSRGCLNYANELSQAALERSSQDAYDVIRLTRSKAVWTVDYVARLIDLKKKNSYLFCHRYRISKRDDEN